MNKVDYIFAILAEENPHPETELYYTNIFTLLVAVMLSAQATDKGVNKATPELFKIADTASKMMALGEEGLITYIKSIGLYKSKAKNIIRTCQILVEKHDGKVPSTREELEGLPGVGRKTANVVLSVGFGIPAIAVDTHVFRVSRRLGLSKGNTPLAVENDLVKMIPESYLSHAHHWLILHGRYVCKATKPLCAQCKISAYCDYFKDHQGFPSF